MGKSKLTDLRNHGTLAVRRTMGLLDPSYKN
jgi:hypothetical protein